MKKASATAQQRTRDLLAWAVACLLLLNAWASFFAPREKVSLPNAQGVAMAIAGELCHSDAGDAKDEPTQGRHGCQHCVLCGVSARDAALHIAALAVAIVYLRPAGLDAGAAWIRQTDTDAPPPLGWISSWSSRAPPSFS